MYNMSKVLENLIELPIGITEYAHTHTSSVEIQFKRISQTSLLLTIDCMTCTKEDLFEAALDLLKLSTLLS